MIARRLWRFAVVGSCALAVVLVLSALEPSSAQAWLLGLPSPGQVISGLLGGIGHVIGGTVGKLAVTAFDAIVHALFAPIAHFINTQLIGWLVAVPDYAPSGSHVAATEHTVLAMAGAALGAVATISVARFWAAGLAGSGGSAVEGLARTVGAALLLPIWPWLFHTAVALANDASTGLLGSASVTKASANLLAVGVGAGVGLGFLGVGLFVSIVMAVVASILFLGLLMMKVVLAISTVLVFVGMPIAIVLSPVVPWISRALVRAFAVCLAVPLVWAVCFAASGAMLNDGLFLKGSSGFFDALLEPLAAIALLWMMLLLPSRLAQMAMLGAGAVRGGFVSRAVSYAAGSQMRDAARQYLPGLAGGGRGAERSARAGDGLAVGRAAERRERAGREQGRRRWGAEWRLGPQRLQAWRPAREPVARTGPVARRASRGRAGCSGRGVGGAGVRIPRRRSRAGRGRWRRPGVCGGRVGGRIISMRRCSRRRCVSSASRCRASRPGRRAMRSRPPRRARCRVWSPITGRGRASISRIRRWGSGRRTSGRRSARWRRPARRFAPRRSPTGAGRCRGSARAPTRHQRLPGRAPRHPARSPARGPAGNGGNGASARAPHDQPPPERGGDL